MAPGSGSGVLLRVTETQSNTLSATCYRWLGSMRQQVALHLYNNNPLMNYESLNDAYMKRLTLLWDWDTWINMINLHPIDDPLDQSFKSFVKKFPLFVRGEANHSLSISFKLWLGVVSYSAHYNNILFPLSNNTLILY